jgi:hypothetical protein
LDSPVRDDAILSLLDNAEPLYPVFSSVLVVVNQTFDDLALATQDKIKAKVRALVEAESHVMRVEIHLDLAVRILARRGDAVDQVLLERLFDETSSPLLRRDIILAVARCGDWYWLSDLRNKFREMSGPERRAFLVASHILRDEGSHWRRHIREELTPFELFIREWASSKVNQPGWSIPL